MAIEKSAPWVGASGNEYTFQVLGLAPDVPPRLGNYIYAKRNAEGAWVPVFMGHGDLAACCTDAAVQRCIASKGATHLHLRLNGREADRDAELHDLLAHYANAFTPDGCQPRQGAEADAQAKPRRTAKAPAKKAPTKKAPAKKVSTKKVSTKTTPVKKAAAKKASVRKASKPPRPRSK